MKILFIGDIVGKPGRKAIRELLPEIKNRHQIDLVIANCENAAAGFGVTKEIVEELYRYGIDLLTSGNHIWDKKEINEFLEDFEMLLRPANYPENLLGRGRALVSADSTFPVGVINLLGRVFIHPPLECPFRVAEREIARLREKTRVIIVDMHAEATSEKQAMGWFLDGQVSAVVGTHTHVQTADDRILPAGTAYITDVGMTGPFDSVIGIDKEMIIERFLTQIPNRFDVAKKNVHLQGVVIDIDEVSGKSRGIERIDLTLQA